MKNIPKGIFLTRGFIKDFCAIMLMTITIANGHKTVSEQELSKKHVDVLGTELSAETSYEIARETDSIDSEFLKGLRIDLNYQISGKEKTEEGITPIHITAAGQLAIEDCIDYHEIIHETAVDLFQKAGIFDDGRFSADYVTVNTDGVTPQASLINGTSTANNFADTLVI